jgi:uncharacterized protein YicC (UPF0701 family)
MNPLHGLAAVGAALVLSGVRSTHIAETLHLLRELRVTMRNSSEQMQRGSINCEDAREDSAQVRKEFNRALTEFSHSGAKVGEKLDRHDQSRISEIEAELFDLEGQVESFAASVEGFCQRSEGLGIWKTK